MPQHVDPNSTQDESPPLVFRGYQRHRKQSQWGTWSFFFPPAAVLWSVFWLLMMNQRHEGEPRGGIAGEVWLLAIGDVLILLAGTIVASRGVSDPYFKRGRAAIALAVNLFLLLGVVIALSLHLFAG